MNVACIKNGEVKNVIVCEQLPEIPGFDELVDVTNIKPQPGKGWGYDGISFTPPVAQVASQSPHTAGKNLAKTISRADLMSPTPNVSLPAQGKALEAILLLLQVELEEG